MELKVKFPTWCDKNHPECHRKMKYKNNTSAVVPLDKGLPPWEPPPGLASGNLDQLTGSGKTLDTLLNDIEAPVDTKSDTKLNFGFMDRRTILTLKAQTPKPLTIHSSSQNLVKGTDTTDEEFIIKSGKDSEAPILNPNDDHPYLEIYM